MVVVNWWLWCFVEDGVIECYMVVVVLDKVDYLLMIVVNVEVESEQIDQFDVMKCVFECCLQIQQCYYVMGEWDFVLIFVVCNMDQYNVFMCELFFVNNNVKWFKMLVSMSCVKVGFDVLVDVGE